MSEQCMQVLLFSLVHFLHVTRFVCASFCYAIFSIGGRSIAQSAVLTAAEQTKTTTMAKGRKFFREANTALVHICMTYMLTGTAGVKLLTFSRLSCKPGFVCTSQV